MSVGVDHIKAATGVFIPKAVVERLLDRGCQSHELLGLST